MNFQPKTRMAPEIMTVNNNPNISHWSLEGGYSNEMNEHSYPARVFNSRPKSSLVVSLLVSKEDLDNNCNGWVQGFRIYLHLPGETFGVSRKYFQISLLESAKLSVKPTLIRTIESLRSYRPSQRQCFFGSERQLRFFKIYTSQNCETECLANFTKQECGCVKFSQPSKVYAYSMTRSEMDFREHNIYRIIFLNRFFNRR